MGIDRELKAGLDESEWPGSDGLLYSDPVAVVKVSHPFAPPDLERAGIVLPEIGGGYADEAAAAVALAELAEDEEAAGESGESPDDMDVDDPADDEPMEEV